MTAWVGLILDVILMALVATGVVYAMRLIKQLQELKSGRAEMERFVRDFNAAVMRAEAGIKGLRAAAREAGDDLEKLIDKGHMVRDELNFIVESADNVAERLSITASAAMHGGSKATDKSKDDVRKAPPTAPITAPATASAAISGPGLIEPRGAGSNEAAPNSRAEKELLQALQKLK
jgi:hypothetical protein